MAEHRLRWSALPDPVAQRIVRQAFADGGSSVRDWVTLSLVCKCALAVVLRSCDGRCHAAACVRTFAARLACCKGRGLHVWPVTK